MAERVNITYPTALILQALANGYRYGFDVMDATGLPSGTVYPALRRLERVGMVASTWEEPEVAKDELRPARRYYELTADGVGVLARSTDRFRKLANLIPGSAQPSEG